MTDKRIAETLRHLQPPVGFKPWHGGPTALGSLRGVTAAVARWKPYPDRLSIWDLALHIAYWNYAVTRRLTNAPRGTFPRQPRNFPDHPADASPKSWDIDRQLVRSSHEELVSAVASFDSSQLDLPAGDNAKVTFADLITGILLHDTYHVGQIQMLKRMAASGGVR